MHRNALLLAVALTATMGCKNQQKAELEPVPGPVDAGYNDPYAGGYSPVPGSPATPGAAGSGEPQFITIDQAPGASTPIVVGPEGSSYTVKKGDTLWSIAKSRYGNGQKWQDIVAANPGLNPQKLAVGQTITLP